MKMLTLKTTTAALISVLLSSHAYAMVNDDAQKKTVPAVLSPAAAQEKEAYKRAIQQGVTGNDFNIVDNALRGAAGRQWFDQRGIDWVLEFAAFHNQESIIEQLLNRQGNEKPSQDSVVSVFAKLKEHQDDAKLAAVDYLLQQGAIQRVLGQVNLEKMLSKAATRGKRPLVQRLLDLPQGPQFLTDAVHSAARGGQLETFNDLLQQAKNRGTFRQVLLNESLVSVVGGYQNCIVELMGLENPVARQEKLRPYRDIVNQLLNMNENGPTQEGVDRAFGVAVTAVQDLHLVKIMLLDRSTNGLRTGLRPSNPEIIRHRNGFCPNESIANFLKSLNL